MSLSVMQQEHRLWIEHNFPGETGHQAVFGMMEELGELCHALLKAEQGIRGISAAKARELVIDAHCDLIIFSLTLADNMGYDLEEELKKVWHKVKQRDWVENPEGDGFE